MGAVFYHIVSHSLLLWGGAVSLYNVLFFSSEIPNVICIEHGTSFQKRIPSAYWKVCKFIMFTENRFTGQKYMPSYHKCIFNYWLIDRGWCVLYPWWAYTTSRVMLYPLKSWLWAGDPSFPPSKWTTKASKGNFSHYGIHWNTDHCVQH